VRRPDRLYLANTSDLNKSVANEIVS
jgi:hypothetical protein